ncbi:hypothetical protein TURU_002549 [Turdus rufiventris]|nr:hypothetical protein TURU_002549 [Turdus rufiventris]
MYFILQPGTMACPGAFGRRCLGKLKADLWDSGAESTEGLKPITEAQLAQTLPLDFAVHNIQPRGWVLVKEWEEAPLVVKWRGPFQVLLTTEKTIKTTEHGMRAEISRGFDETPDPGVFPGMENPEWCGEWKDMGQILKEFSDPVLWDFPCDQIQNPAEVGKHLKEKCHDESKEKKIIAVAEATEGEGGSSQLAELKAVQLALDIAERVKWPKLYIYIDSWMVANALWGWLERWKKANWQHRGKPIWAAEEWKDIATRVGRLPVKVRHVDAHVPKSRANEEHQNNKQAVVLWPCQHLLAVALRPLLDLPTSAPRTCVPPLARAPQPQPRSSICTHWLWRHGPASTHRPQDCSLACIHQQRHCAPPAPAGHGIVAPSTPAACGTAAPPAPISCGPNGPTCLYLLRPCCPTCLYRLRLHQPRLYPPAKEPWSCLHCPLRYSGSTCTRRLRHHLHPQAAAKSALTSRGIPALPAFADRGTACTRQPLHLLVTALWPCLPLSAAAPTRMRMADKDKGKREFDWEVNTYKVTTSQLMQSYPGLVDQLSHQLLWLDDGFESLVEEENPLYD